MLMYSNSHTHYGNLMLIFLSAQVLPLSNSHAHYGNPHTSHKCPGANMLLLLLHVVLVIVQ